MTLECVPNPVSDLLSSAQGTMTDFQKKMYEQINSSEGAFQNKLSSGMTQTNSYISSAQEELEGFLVAPPVGRTVEEIQEVIDKTEAISTSMNTFQSHTNALSGVDLNPTGLTPSLTSLMAVGRSSVALNHALERLTNNPCAGLLEGFASLFCGEEIVSNIGQLYQDVITNIQDTEVAIASITGSIEEYKNQIDDLVTGDRTYFNNLLADLQRAALSQVMGDFYNDPCGRYLLTKVIGKDSLVAELKEEYGE